MSARNSDCNLLFGLLALQNGFLSREDLVAAVSMWLDDKSQSLDEILLARHALSKDEHELLSALVKKHLDKHGDSIELSLVSLSSLTSPGAVFTSLEDPDADTTHAFITHGKTTQANERSIAGEPTATGQRFRIIRPHAEGGLGRVSVANDEELHREVALKEIKPRYAHDTECRARFTLEAEITGGLEHPGIVPIYSLGQYSDGRPFYAMRFIKGDSLQAAVELFHQRASPATGSNASTVALDTATLSCHEATSRPDARGGVPLDFLGIEFRKLLGRFIDVCQAIEYAHSRGVLHRDLKPNNIMLGKYGETLVVDWGLAKAVGRNENVGSDREAALKPSSGGPIEPTAIGSVLGTPAYMSPEQAAGRLAELGPTSDVYSLGATLYQLLTGRAPFARLPLSELLSRLERGDFPRPHELQPWVPKALEAVCLKAMSIHANDRYSSAADLAEELESWLADEPVNAWREPPVVRARRFIKRHQTLAASTAVALVVGLAGLVALTAAIGDRNLQLAGKNQQLDTLNRELDGTNERLATKNNELIAAIEREREAKTIAEQNEQTARVNEEFAREQSQLALSTLNNMIFEVSRGLRNVPGAGPTRRKLLATALERLESISDKYLARAKIDLNLAGGLSDMADLIVEIGAADWRTSAASMHFSSPVGFSDDEELPSVEAPSSLAIAERLYSRALNIAGQLAKEMPTDQLTQNNLSVAYLQRGAVANLLGKKLEALAYFEKVQEQSRERLAAEPGNVEAQKFLAVSCQRLGSVALSLGQNRVGMEQYKESQLILEQRAAEDAGNPETQQQLAISLDGIGASLANLGQRRQALPYFQKSMEIREQQAANAPHDSDAQRRFAISLSNLGTSALELGKSKDALVYFGRSSEIVRKAEAAEPLDAGIQRELANSLLHLGDASRRLGQETQALAYYRQALEIRTRRALADPGDVEAELLRVHTFLKLSEVLLQLGQAPEALTYLEQGLKFSEQRAAAGSRDARAQCYPGFWHVKWGETLLTQGRHPEALAHFQKAREVFERGATIDPGNDALRRNTAVAYFKLGEASRKLAAPHESLTYLEKFRELSAERVATNPEDIQTQHDLALALSTLGDLSLELDQIERAVAYYQQSIAVKERLAVIEPENLTDQQILASLYVTQGGAMKRAGRPQETLVQYEKSLALRENLAAADPQEEKYLTQIYALLGAAHEDLGHSREALQLFAKWKDLSERRVAAEPENAEVQRDVVRAYERLGGATLRIGQTPAAHVLFEKFHELALRRVAADPENEEDQGNLSIAKNRLGAMQLRLGQPQRALPFFQEVHAFSERRAAAHSKDSKAQRLLSISHTDLGKVLLRTGQTTEALAHFRQALVIRENLAGAALHDAPIQHDLMAAHVELGNAAQSRYLFLEAREHYLRGRDVLDAFMQRAKRQTFKLEVDDLNSTLAGCERCRRAIDDPDFALTQDKTQASRLLFTRAKAMLSYAGYTEEELPEAIREKWNAADRQNGLLREAAASADKLRTLEPANANSLYNSSCLFSICLKEVVRLDAGPDSWRKELQQKTLSTLDAAIAAGFKDAEHMAKDVDFEPIRELPEFKSLLERLRTQPK